MNIAIAGLTAAGKTTHAKILAECLGYRYVSATELILQLTRFGDDPRGVWFRNFEKLEALRADDSLDDQLERHLLAMAGDAGVRIVFDTWALPWLYRGPLVRIWIESDQLSRLWKCYVSQLPINPKPFAECAQFLHVKDTSTRERFMRRHTFDLYADHDVFDAILTNTHLISAPTVEATRKGIAEFAPVVQATAECFAFGDSEPIRRLERDGSVAQRLSMLRIRAR
jgi:cytidylate kinase